MRTGCAPRYLEVSEMKTRRWIPMLISGLFAAAAACSAGNPVGVQDDNGRVNPPAAPMDTSGFAPVP
jgi:hypothetical protein